LAVWAAGIGGIATPARAHPLDPLYAPPIEGVEAIVDLTKSRIARVIDTGPRAISRESTDFFDGRVRGSSRPALKPLVTVQPDGPSFTIEGNDKEINGRAAAAGKDNNFQNAFQAVQTVFGREREAARDVNPASRRVRAVFNPGVKTALGHNPAYVLEPEGNTWPFLPPQSVVRKFAGFLDHHFFATRFHPREMNAAGPYASHAAKPDNLAAWSMDNEPILNEDVVAWYTFGLTHTPRPEDYPVMPTARAGFKLVPHGIFTRNPSLDVPAPQ
jgi:Cu2+-containing amine oxidase